MLVKAPKFEDMPGFVPRENGLFEVKLILTGEGLVFVNFASSTKGLPFAGLRSKLPAPELQWKESFVFSTDLNWKNVGESDCMVSEQLGLTRAAREFAQRVAWSQATFGWAHPWRKQKPTRQLGPLSILRELEQGAWCTMTVLPIKASKTDVVCDVFGIDITIDSGCIVQRWKARLEKEVATFSSIESKQLQPFIYECGGEYFTLCGAKANRMQDVRSSFLLFSASILDRKHSRALEQAQLFDLPVQLAVTMRPRRLRILWIGRLTHRSVPRSQSAPRLSSGECSL